MDDKKIFDLHCETTPAYLPGVLNHFFQDFNNFPFPLNRVAVAENNTLDEYCLTGHLLSYVHGN